MRKSSLIKLVLLGGGALAVGGCCVCAGAGTDDDDPPDATAIDTDPQWYDAGGSPIPVAFAVDDACRLVPVGDPRDRSGRPLQFDEFGDRIFVASTVAAGAAYASRSGSGNRSSSYRRSSSLFPFWTSRPSSSYGGSRPPTGTGSGGSTYFGGSRPGTSSAPRSSGASVGGGSVSRGGFGSGGASSSG